jgi:hypothetical protein
MVRDRRVSVRVEKELYAAIERLAENEHRTMSQWVELRLKEMVRAAEGATPAKKKR